MALIPPFFLDCVVAIGVIGNDGKKYWLGTGFIFGNFKRKVDDQINEYLTYLVTNKHVLEGKKEIILKFNKQIEHQSQDFKLILNNNHGSIWTGHPDEKKDVAVVGFDIGDHQPDLKFNYFLSDNSTYTKDILQEKGISEGDTIFVLGYPMGMVDQERQYAILRGGSIARIKPMYDGKTSDFIIDASIFPGNSGGPVIIKPEMIHITGTQSNKNAALIGIVKSYITYQDRAISQQTGNTRVIFEENSGLASVEPVDYILDCIDLHEKKKVLEAPEFP